MFVFHLHLIEKKACRHCSCVR